MAPNWDDDFDFDDIDDATKNKKQNNKKAKPVDDDFFDDDAGGSKLPAIGGRNSVTKGKPQGRSSATRKNPYAENMNLKGNSNIYDNLDEEFEEEIAEEPPKNSSPINNYGSNKQVKSIKNISKYAVDDDMQF